MTDDMSLGVGLGKLFQEGTHGGFLSLSTGIVSDTFFVQASFIDNAKGAMVVMAGVDALDVLRE